MTYWKKLLETIEDQKHEADRPPKSWESFLLETTDVFIRKDTDYDSRFLRGLMELDAATIWAWEVDKKLDRIRSWIKRGELQVKGEGLNNAVQDLFNYTVVYALYLEHVHLTHTPGNVFLMDFQDSRFDLFYGAAQSYPPTYWLDYLVKRRRVTRDELMLLNIISLYMGRKPTKLEWEEASLKMIGQHFDEEV